MMSIAKTLSHVLPPTLFVEAVRDARYGKISGVNKLCAWFNARRAPPMAMAGSVHVWVRDPRDMSRIRIALGPREVEFDHVELVTQRSWRDAVAIVGSHVYVVFIRKQTSCEANESGLVELALVNGTFYESYDMNAWDDCIVATRELAAFPTIFPAIWRELVHQAENKSADGDSK